MIAQYRLIPGMRNYSIKGQTLVRLSRQHYFNPDILIGSDRSYLMNLCRQQRQRK